MSLLIYPDRQDSFSTVPSMVNGGDWGYIVRDLETVIVLVLPAFNFIPQRSHHAFTLTRSWFRDSATVTWVPGDGTTAIKVESSAWPIILFSRMEKSSEVYRRNNNGPKTLPWGTHDTTLTSLLRHSSTKTNSELHQYRQHRTSDTHRAEPIENSLVVDPIKSSTGVDLQL